jgi:hypothetical protein
LLTGPAHGQQGANACRVELERGRTSNQELSADAIRRLIDTTLASRAGLSCVTYARMVDMAEAAARTYLRRPTRDRANAHDAVRIGEIAQARAAYGDVVAAARRGATPDTLADVYEAAILATSASDFLEASRLYGERAALSGNDQEAFQAYRALQASALANAGELHADGTALEQALGIYRQLSLEMDRSHDEWHTVQASLGDAVFTQSQQETDRHRREALLSNAIDLYRVVSEIRQEFSDARDWARTQYNLGLALSERGALRASSAELVESVGAFENALAVYTADRAPQYRANTMLGVARSLVILSATEANPELKRAHLVRARDYVEQLVVERPRDIAPFDWASAQGNLARIYIELARLSQSETGSEQTFGRAITAARASLTVFTFEETAEQWSRAQGALGDALMNVATRDPTVIPEAIAAFRAQQRERTREADPHQWGRANVSIALAYALAAERDPSQLRLARDAAEEAVAAFDAAGTPAAAQDASFARAFLSAMPPS